MNIVQTDNAPKAIGPYSQAIRAGDLLFVAGQLPLSPDGALVGEGDIRAQTRAVLANLGAILEAAGSSMRQVVKTTVFLTDLADFAGMNEIWDAWVVAGQAPCRATVNSRLARPEWRVEIVVTAAA